MMSAIAENCVYILSIEAKDLTITNHQLSDHSVYPIRQPKEKINTAHFTNTLDYSLELIKLREVYKKVFRRQNFSFWIDGKEYSKQIINVTFQYSNKLYNPAFGGVYLKFGYTIEDIEWKDNVCVKKGELIAIRTGIPVCNPLPEEILHGYFVYQDGVYIPKNIPTLHTTAELRKELYEKGFYYDGIRYVRYKRSNGSARIGKCLFINERLYPAMHKWELCGLQIKEGQEIDLAALEAYISLPLSSIIDTIHIEAKNILVIEDYESTFCDNVVLTHFDQNRLHSAPSKAEITNSIWDGQSLLDSSLFTDYPYGMLLLRNRFFKSCCFNTNIQQFFSDNGICDIAQLNGYTLAKRVNDIKLVTTPSSIKYLKFGKLKDWLMKLDPIFGIVKHEKPPHGFSGRMVQTHYQLLNTLQLDLNDVKDLLTPSLDYVRQLRENPAVLRYHIKCPAAKKCDPESISSKQAVVYKLMSLNNRFCETKLYQDFVKELIKSYLKNLRRGHIYVNGNYSVLFGNPLEMLKSSIGQFDGSSSLSPGQIHSKRFPFGRTILGSRSPHVTMGNIMIAENVSNYDYDTYFNLSKEIVCVNSIKDNVLERLSGADFDSDTVLLTDNPILLEAALKNYSKFMVPSGQIPCVKARRRYTNAEKADLDIKTSVNKIGEIINLSQELNSRLWDRINRGDSFESVEQLYFDITTLDVMSGIEIDKAKKEFTVDNTAELTRIRNKYEIRDKCGKQVKPFFFGFLAKEKGLYSDSKRYTHYLTTMDYVQKVIGSFRLPKTPLTEFISFSQLLYFRDYNPHSVNYEQVREIIETIHKARCDVMKIWEGSLTSREKYERSEEIRQKCVRCIDGLRLNPNSMLYLLNSIEQESYAKIRRYLLTVLFSTGNQDFYALISKSKEHVPYLEESKCGEIQLFEYHFKLTYDFEQDIKSA